MSDVPEASGGEPADDASSEMARGESLAPEDVPAGEAPHPDPPTSTDWWRRDPEPSRAASSPLTPPAGSPPPGAGTPPFGTPPFGPEPSGTPPFGTPPFGSPPAGSGWTSGTESGETAAGTQPWSVPSWAVPPSGGPSWGGPPWGAPPWMGPPYWYGWGPAWHGAGPPPASPPNSPSTRLRSVPWVIVGGVLAVVAMVALGLGIGYSVWGSGSTAAVRSGSRVPAPRTAPAPGRVGFLGVEVVSSGLAPGASPPSSTSSTSPPPGAYVLRVVPSSPAAKAGIVKGDTITAFAGHLVHSAVTLRVDVLRLAPGAHVKVAWVTPTGKHMSATLTLARRPTTSSIG